MNRKFVGEVNNLGAGQESFWLSRASQERAARPGGETVPEPRHSLRCHLDLQVLLNYGLTYSAAWHVRDLSLSGIFIEMDARQLVEGTSVEVVLRYRHKDKTVEQRLAATVTRIEADGAALTFDRYDDQAYTDLANLLYAD